jgi:cation transport ATPase
MAIFGLKVLMGTYLIIRAFETVRAYTKKQKKPCVNVIKTAHGTQMESIADANETKVEHYLKLSTAAIFLVPLSYFYSPLILLTVGVISYITVPILKQTEESLIKERRFKGDLFNSLISILCMTTGQYFLAALLAWFYHLFSKIALKIQHFPRLLFLTHLFEWQPNTVWILKENEVEIEIPIQKLNINDIVVVNAGELVPVDGLIVKGQATVDQYALTGEMQLTQKGKGEDVFAATRVINGQIFVKAERIGKNTTISQMSERFFR